MEAARFAASAYPLSYNPVYTLVQEYTGPMQADLFLSSILICLGAMIAYLADEKYAFTPRLEAWIGRVLGEG